MHCHTHPMQLISQPSPRFATSQVFVFDRPLLRVTVTHPAVSEHPTERAQCVNVQSESPSFPPADSLSPASSLKCFTRSSSARHDKSSADVIRPAASDSRANRRGCVSVCVRLRACQMCKKAEKNFCKHWWLCCNSIIYLPFFIMYWIKGAVCLRHNSSENSFFFFGVTTSKTLQFVKILPFSTHRHADGGSGDILSSAQRFLKPSETKPAASVNTSENKHSAPRAVSSNCPHDLALHFFLSPSKLRHSDLLARKDPPLPPKTRAEVPLSLETEQLPAVWKLFSVHLDLLEPCTATWLLWQ